MKQLQQEISQLQVEFRSQTKRAKESQHPKVRLLTFPCIMPQIAIRRSFGGCNAVTNGTSHHSNGR